MDSAILIFAIWLGRPAVLEYRGPINRPFIQALAKEISFEEAERRMRRADPPVLFAPPNYAVVRVLETDAKKLLAEWEPYEGKKATKRMRAAFRTRTRKLADRNLRE